MIDKYITIADSDKSLLDIIKSNISSKFATAHASKINILTFSNGRKIAIRRKYTYKGDNIINTSFVEVYFLTRIDDRYMYFISHAKETSKGMVMTTEVCECKLSIVN